MEQTPPLVSVLLPAYNCVGTLGEAIASLTCQSLHDIEIIVVNDGSADGTGALLDALALEEPRLRVVHTANKGIVDALNTALGLARGEYVARMDGDDRSHPERLSLQVSYLRDHPDCVCVGSLYRLMDSDGRITAVQQPFGNLPQTDLTIFPPRITTLPHPSILLRTADLKALSGYRHGFSHAEDYDLFLRLAERGELGLLQLPLLDYRIHSGSLSAKNLVPQVDSALRATLSALERNGLSVGAGHAGTDGAVDEGRLPAIWAAYRGVRLAEAAQGRGLFNLALTEATRACRPMLRAFLNNFGLLGYWRLGLRLLKVIAKIALRRT
ncbi:MAG: hypothetical protein CFE46_17815 [Burkholderiales bacterium PBB6]|nr:MAG: hypothetical protein CFE46_17815 [Burkholderiales bacterium PBB6]